MSGCTLFLSGCTPPARPPGEGATNVAGTPVLRVLSGSENKALEPILDRFAAERHVRVQMDYLGSVDIMLRLQEPRSDYDAVWPANSLWVELGDTHKRVKHEKSIMRSPVVLGVKRSVAQRLGWVDKKSVTVEEILDAAEAGKLRFMMTSATQSNSGASAYFGFLYAFAGRPEVLKAKDLQNPAVQAKVRRILGTVNRSSGSSGWLKDLFLQKYDRYDAMVNYESVVIEANQDLVREGKEPLYAVYPSDGLAIADSPLGYVDRGDKSKEDLFLKLQAYLLSPPVQQQILSLGRRVGLVGVELPQADRAIFNPAWGIDTKRILSPIRFPQADVIRQALTLYQTALRKPSFTVYCLDFSGSMQGKGETDLKDAMRTLLDPAQAKRYFLQASAGDLTAVIPFDSAPRDEWLVKGSDPAQLTGLLGKIDALQAGDGTDIYTPVMHAFDLLKRTGDLRSHFPAVILMTDGRSNEGADFAALQSHLAGLNVGADVPVFAILFGDASKDQLQQITSATSGRIFDGSKDLVTAFREARGYN